MYFNEKLANRPGMKNRFKNKRHYHYQSINQCVSIKNPNYTIYKYI